MKNFSNIRKSGRIKPFNILLVVTKNAEYKRTKEYISIVKDYKNYRICAIVIGENTSINNIKNSIKMYVKELDFNKNRGDRIVILSDILEEGGGAMNKTNALK